HYSTLGKKEENGRTARTHTRTNAHQGTIKRWNPLTLAEARTHTRATNERHTRTGEAGTPINEAPQAPTPAKRTHENRQPERTVKKKHERCNPAADRVGQREGTPTTP
ncbi:MAG: hypothetical protein CL798_04355, partial [Chromatiales bacterium]|nr:hypothetical protein [Chromatiales bacterium]